MLAKIKINLDKVAITHNNSPKTLELVKQLQQLYQFCSLEEAEVIAVVGGDGELLHAIHRHMDLEIPFFGVNSGNIGFLMNSVTAKNLMRNLENAKISYVHPLEMQTETIEGKVYSALAINPLTGGGPYMDHFFCLLR